MSAKKKDDHSLVEASIENLQTALTTGLITCVELVLKLLIRISTYDCRGISLNSIPILNPNVFVEAAASDERRANGKTIGALDGIPYTVKDSYKVKGMTVASGSAAFQNLVSSEDAFLVAILREAGAVLIGKTSMPPMAAGGLRGLYGQAKSPYSPRCLAAAFASGSSTGSAVATAASFATFGLGGETVSSGRSPASNNSLVAYTPSRGGISIRGTWPLYSTCDVVVPHTRTMSDLFTLLDTIIIRDEVTVGDFWRDQPFVQVQDPWERKSVPLQQISSSASLKGLHIAVPEMYIGGRQSLGCTPVYTSSSVRVLWQQAKADLERLGARVTLITSFPMIEQYERPDSTSTVQHQENPRLPNNWNFTERSSLIAHAWEDFLVSNNQTGISSLSDISYEDIYPSPSMDDPQLPYLEPANRIQYENLAWCARHDKDAGRSIYDIPQLSEALGALEAMRKVYFEDWLSANSFDCVAFPAAGDVGAADADVNHGSAEHAWRNGVKYSNGNRALRHLGIPTITVPMGVIEDKDMPLGLTFCGRGGSDVDLLCWGRAFEAGTKRRYAPKLVPALTTDQLDENSQDMKSKAKPPKLTIKKCMATHNIAGADGTLDVVIEGLLAFEDEMGASTNPLEPILDIFIDASPVSAQDIHIQKEGSTTEVIVYEFQCRVPAPVPPQRDDRRKIASRKRILRDSTMVVILAKNGVNGWPSATVEVL